MDLAKKSRISGSLKAAAALKATSPYKLYLSGLSKAEAARNAM